MEEVQRERKKEPVIPIKQELVRPSMLGVLNMTDGLFSQHDMNLKNVTHHC